MRGISGNRWDVAERQSPELLNHILDVRGVSREDRESFLRPKIKDALPDPFFMIGMRESANRLADDIMSGRNVGIFSDYDADGATSAGVLGRWLRSMGKSHHSLVIPDRKVHGYGPNAELIHDEMFAGGCDSVFVLDSGTVAAGVLNPLPDNMRRAIFVIDHHMPFGDMPDIGAVVNPNRVDQQPGLGHMAACGVTFLLCVAAQRELVKRGHLPQSSMQDLMALLDYVAIGTVCDVVPLVGVNRALVYQGLQRVNMAETNPIGALMRAAGKGDATQVKASDCGFVIGPRLNAEGRIGDPRAAAQFLLAEDPDDIRERAQRLHATNAERKAQQDACNNTALDDAEINRRSHSVIAITDGHEGIVGISASKLKEAFQMPAIVLTSPEPGIIKGSARSVDGFNIGDAIHKAHDLGLIIKGGGHGMAGGLTMKVEKLEALRDFLNAEVMDSHFGREGLTIAYDALMSADDVHVEVITSLEAMEPYGRANEAPKFVIENARIRELKVMKDTHIKLVLHSKNNPFKSLDALMWGAVGTPAGDLLMAAANEADARITLGVHAEINRYKDRERVQLIIGDVLDPDA